MNEAGPRIMTRTKEGEVEEKIVPPGASLRSAKCGSPKRSPPLGVRDRLRARLDERRWLDYSRSPLSIFYQVQP